jgi:hypothetical protein
MSLNDDPQFRLVDESETSKTEDKTTNEATNEATNEEEKLRVSREETEEPTP